MKGKSLILVLVMLLLVLSGSVPISRPVDYRAQPQLVALAASQPDADVKVIVQKAGHDERVAQAVKALGGEVTRDLSIINALGARLTVMAALQLSVQPGVKWVSLDAPAVKSNVAASPNAKRRPTNTINPANAFRDSIRAGRLQDCFPDYPLQCLSRLYSRWQPRHTFSNSLCPWWHMVQLSMPKWGASWGLICICRVFSFNVSWEPWHSRQEPFSTSDPSPSAWQLAQPNSPWLSAKNWPTDAALVASASWADTLNISIEPNAITSNEKISSFLRDIGLTSMPFRRRRFHRRSNRKWWRR